MNELICKYKKLDAEYDLLTEICRPLYEIKYRLKTLGKNALYAEVMAEGVVNDAILILKLLEKRIDDVEQEINSLAAAILKNDHGIRLGEKIPFNHSGSGKSGNIRVEKVEIYFIPDLDENTFIVSGPRFKKDGTLGKSTETTYLRVLSDCD